MTTQNTIKNGTWIRSRIAISDSGDFNEREAPAGALGRIELLDGEGETASFSVIFFPSFIQNFWDFSEISRDAEILPVGHPDIPSRQEFNFASGVADILADGEVDDDEQEVSVSRSLAARILACTNEGRYAGKPEIAEILGDGKRKANLSFEDFNRLAAIAGIGDRLEVEPAMAP